MSENEKPAQKAAEGETNPEELSEQALAEVSGGAVAERSFLEQDAVQVGQVAGVFSSSGLDDDGLHFKYDIKGNKEG